MSSSSLGNKRILVAAVAAVLTVSGALASAGDGRYDDRYDPRYDVPHDSRYDEAQYDYAKVVDVEPLIRRVRVTTPQRECWDETRYEERGYRTGPNVAGGTLLGAVIGAAIGNQIGHGDGRRAATAGGAIVGAAIGRQQAERRSVYHAGPAQPYTVQRCQTNYREEWEERVDGYRVTYLYHGRRQVTELPYRPGDRIRVRVDVSPAE
jgi:uncharacterized protein YcfJ